MGRARGQEASLGTNTQYCGNGDLFQRHIKSCMRCVCVLFDDIERTRLEPTTRILPTFETINSFDWYGSAELRDALEDWFSRYPVEHRDDLVARFRSDKNYNHDGAFFELACHELLRRLGFDLEVHPAIPESNNHPDFLARGGDKDFYVEATVTGKRYGPFTPNANEQGVISDLNTLASDDFYIGVEMEGELKRTLPKHEIVGVFRELLTTSTREGVSNRVSMGRRYDAPSETITDGDWTLQGWPVPISDPERKVGRSEIVLYPFTAARTGVVDGVRKAIDRKRKRYGKLHAPLVVAVNIRDPYYNGKRNDMDVLLGDEVIRYDSVDPDASGKLDRKCNGIWYRQRRIDAVLLCKSFDIWNLRNATGSLYFHPLGNIDDFPADIIQIPHAVTNDIGTEWFDGCNFTRLLGCEADGLFH